MRTAPLLRGRAVVAVLVGYALSASPAAHADLLYRVSFEYDEEGRLISERHVEPATSSDVVVARHGYDVAGRRTSTTDALGRTTKVTYDALGRVATSRDAAGGLTEFEYTPGDRVKQVTDPRGLVTQYDWDGLGNLWKQVSPDTGTTTFEYGPDGLRTRMTRNDGSVTTYVHDGKGRLLQAKAGGAERNFRYDDCTNGRGRLCVAEFRENGILRNAVAHDYTEWGWLTLRHEQGVDDAGSAYDHVTAYQYDGSGRVTGIAYPSGVGVGYSYTAGRLAGMVATIGGMPRTVVSNISHQPFGPIDGWTYGSGLERRYRFDRNGRLLGVSSAAADRVVLSLTYGFNAADEITAITHGTDAGQSRALEYDALGRLAKETRMGGTWQFDGNGNRVAWREAGVDGAAVIDAASNRITHHVTAGGMRQYVHDALGNRIGENVDDPRRAIPMTASTASAARRSMEQ